MNFFVLLSRLSGAALALLIMQNVSAVSQDRNGSLTAPPLNLNPQTQSRVNPSFDCRAAHSSVERAICGDVTLSEWDARMGQLFQQILRQTRDRQTLLQSQRLWLTQRDSSCSAVTDTEIWSCLLEMTKLRAATLAKAAPPIAEPTQIIQSSPIPVIQTTPQGPVEHSLGTSAGNQNAASVPPPSTTNSKTDIKSEGHTFTYVFMLLLILSGVGLIVALKIRDETRRKQRLAAEIQRLVTLYGEEIASRIMAREIWQGMTDEQLVESRGSPSDVGREIIREKIRETWKYHQIGRNRFRERIYLENGIVIGWKY